MRSLEEAAIINTAALQQRTKTNFLRQFTGRIVFPREHGSWALWLVPFFIGTGLTRYTAADTLLLIAALFAFMASTPAVLAIKQPTKRASHVRWTMFYLLLSFSCAVWLLPAHPVLLAIAVAAVPFFAVDILFIKLRKERHLLNDLAGMLGLSLTIFAVTAVNRGHFTWSPLHDMAIYIPFFFGSALHVKALIRERKRPVWKYIAVVYHVVLILAYAALHMSPWLALAAIFGLLRVALQPQRSNIAVITTGLVEIAMSIVYFVLFLMAVQPSYVAVGRSVLWIAVITVAVNWGLGIARARVAKFSVWWFVLIHASIPLVIYLRITMHVGYGWIPVTLYAAVMGQLLGSRYAKRRRTLRVVVAAG